MLPVLDLFSGIGGFSLGLERTGGFSTVAFCEIEPYCQSVLGRHWPGVPVFSDVRLLSGDTLELCGIERPRVICGGFPCQDISLAGAGAGLSGSRSGLWFEFHRLIDEIRPDYALIENVSALRSRGLDQVLGSLAAIGYDAEWHCIPAAAVGAPHRRDRVWIVAHPVGQQLRQQSGRGSGARGTSAALAAEHGTQRDVAHTDHARLEGRLGAQLQERAGQLAAWQGGALPDPDSHGEHAEPVHAEVGRASEPFIGAGWVTEPDVGRVAHGVPARVDRLRALGNAVVPQIPEILGRAILEGLA